MATTDQYVVQIVLDLIDNAKAGWKNVTGNLKSLTAVGGKTRDEFSSFGATWDKMGTQLNRSSTMMNKVKGRVAELADKTGRFKFEMLSVMFFGMAIQKVMNGLLQPAFEVAGAFDALSYILETLFLPIGLYVQDILWNIADVFDLLPEDIQFAIGGIVLFIGILGGLLATLGIIVLGLEGLVMVFGPLFGVTGATVSQFGILGAAGTTLSGIVGGISSVLTTLVGLISGPVLLFIALLGMAWVTNSEGILNSLGNLFATFQRIFGGLWEVISGFVDLLIAIFTLDAAGAFEALRKIGEGTVNALLALFIGLPMAILSIINEIGLGVARFVLKLPEFFLELGGIIVQRFGEGIAGAGGRLAEIFWSIIPQPFRGWLQGAVGAVGNIVGTIASGIGGFVGGVGKIFGFQHGGIVTKPTLALLGESGPEAVTPLGDGGGIATTNISPTYIIHASITSDMDIRTLAQKLNEHLVSDFKRLSYG